MTSVIKWRNRGLRLQNEGAKKGGMKRTYTFFSERQSKPCRLELQCYCAAHVMSVSYASKMRAIFALLKAASLVTLNEKEVKRKKR